MSAYAKSVVAAAAAVIIAGITAWQVAAADGFQLADLLPLGIAVGSAALTWLVPNVPELPWAKGAVSGVLAILTALSTFVTDHPAEVNAANLLVAGLGAVLVWYVPNLPAMALAPAGSDGTPNVTSLPREQDAPPAADTRSPVADVVAQPATTVAMSADEHEAEYQKYIAALSTDEPTEPAPTAAVDRTPQPIELEAQAAATNPGLPAASGDDTGVIPTVGQPPVPAGATAVTAPTA